MNHQEPSSVAKVRAEIVDTILAVLAVFSVFQIVALIWRSSEFSDPAHHFRIGILLLLVFCYVARNLMPHGLKAGIIICSAVLAGISSLSVFGLSAAGMILLLSSVMITALILNHKLAIGCLVICIITLIFFAKSASSGSLAFVNSADEYNVSLSAWTNQGFMFIILASILLFTVKKMINALIESNVKLSQQSEEVQKQAQRASDLLLAAVDAMPYRVFWKDSNLVYRGANKLFAQDAGEERASQLIGKSDYDFPWTDEADAFRADDQAVLDSKTAKLHIEEMQTTPTGEKIYLVTNKVPLIAKDGEVIGVLGTYDDVTKSKMLELDLAKAKAEAESANIAKSQFLANMSHEIRTPLNGINGLINLTLESDLTDLQADYLLKAKSSVGNLSVIINDILDISKIEANKLVIEAIPFSPNEIVGNLEDFIKSLINWDKVTFSIVCKVPEEVSLIGDPTRLLQVLINLTSNAVKFTASGAIELSLFWDEITQQLQFSIKDTGIGISREDQKKLFTSFNQADPSITRDFGGTGLGLSIVKNLCYLMGGRIDLESEVGKGSRFYGFVKAEAAGDVFNEHTEVEYDYNIAGTRILLVEDNAINRLIAEKTLATEDVKITSAVDGVECMDYLDKHTFDVILMDIQMPNMDGIEAIKRIRAQSHLADLPVIALTANVLSDEVAHYYEIGFNEHLAKPFEKNQIIETIGKVLTLPCPE